MTSQDDELKGDLFGVFMGEIAALLTAVFWSFTSIFFTIASRALGSVHVNRVRLVLGMIYLMITHTILFGQPFPVGAGIERWLWLGASGIVGLVFGDACLFQSYVLIGTRLGTLMMAVAPVISTILAWLFLGEALSWLKIFGILVTVAGIILVVLERNGTQSAAEHGDRRRYALGLLFGLGAALGQAGGLILAKRGLTGDFPAVSGVMMRMVVAVMAMWLPALFNGQWRVTVRKTLENRKMLGHIALGATFGPFLGVWLSLVAVQATYVGVASTLMSLMPVIVLPILKWGFKEKITRRAVMGTLVALAGVALLFL